MPAKSYDEIDSIATRMQQAGAPRADIEQYVRTAMQELQSSSGGAAAPAMPAAPDNSPQSASPAAPPERMYKPTTATAAIAQGMLGNPYNLQQIPQKDAKRVVVGGLRYGLPLAATMVSGGMGAPLLVSMGAGAGSAMAGEGLAQGYESGQITDRGALTKAAIFGAVPATRLISGTGAGPAISRIIAEGGKFAALEALGETARKSINAGEFTRPYDSLGEAALKMGTAGAVGSVFQGASEGASKIARMAAQRAERLATLEAGGVVKPSLDLIFPSQAALVNRIAASNPAVAKLRLDATRPLMQQFDDLAAGAPGNEAIYRQLRPFVGKLDSLRDEVATLEQRAAALRTQANSAQSAAALSPEARAALLQEATATELNAVNTQARLLRESQVDLGGFMDYDTSARQFGEVVDRLFKTRKDLGTQRFDAARIPNVPIFDKTDMLAAAQKGLERWRGTDLEKRILGAIEDAGGAESTALTLQQFRELRQTFTDRFAGLDPRQLASAEAASRAAYGALSDASKQTIARVPGADLKAYEAALGYWRDTAEAASSRYARPLLAQEPSESTFQSLASDLASGRKAEVRAFNEFVDAVATDAPEVAQLARQRLTQAVRNSFLGQARTATGIDPKKLTDSLLRAENQIEIGALGFGSSTDIRRWADSLREFNVRNLGEADLDRMFADPIVQRAVSEGRSLGEALRPAVARQAFEQRVQEQALQLAIGKTSEAQARAAQAAKAADVAGLSAAERRRVLDQVESDPIMQAFSGGQTWGIPTRPGDFAATEMNSITNTMLNLGPDDGLRLVNALRGKNPDLADQLQRRVLADVFQKAFRPANTPGDVWALNKAEIQRFFAPKPGSNEATRLDTVKALVGPARLREMEKMLRAVELVADVEKAGGILSTDGSKTIFANTGIGRDLTAKLSPEQGLVGLRSLRTLFDKAQYHTLANLASPGPLRDAFWASGGNLNRALDTMGAQRFFLLARDPALREEIEGQNQ